MNNIFSLFNSLMNNPMQTLLQKGLNIPQNIVNNPEQIIQHLLNSGQISQEQVNQAVSMKNSPMFNNLR